MVLILGDEIRKAMKERGITVIGNLVFGWSSKDKVLVIAEKKKEFYEIYGVRVYVSDGKMQRACVSETVRNVEEIGNRMVSVARNTADQWIEGYAIRDPHTSIHMLFTAEEGKAEIKQIPPIPETKQLPSYVNAIGYICDKNLQPTEMPISLTEESLLHHILITGMTGSGKTSVVMKIVSEVRKTGKPVLVVTPQPGPWKKVSGVHVLTDEDEELKDAVNLLDIRSFTRDVEETVKTLSSLVEFFSHSEETQQLKLLVVFDETHKLMAYDELTKILDSAARELRKYGVALIFISQSCFDFARGIRGDIHTHIAMRTVWSNDLIYIKQHSNIPKGNDGFFEPLRHTSNGIGILYSHMPCLTTASFWNMTSSFSR